jgi:polyene glycosyltransferase
MEVSTMSSGGKPILFVSLPEAGLINPLLIIATELSRRGIEDLWFATDEPLREEIETLAEGAPVNFASLGEVVPELSAKTWDDKVYRKVTQRSRWRAHRAVVWHTIDMRLRIGKYRALNAVAERIKPALMIIDNMSVFGIEVAIKHKIPYILSSPFMPSGLLFSQMPRSFPMLHSGLPLKMTLPQRIYNTIFRLRAKLMFLHPKLYLLLRKSFPDRRALRIPEETFFPATKVKRADIVLCYSVFGLEYPFPIPDKLKMIGAIIPPLPEAPEDRDISGWLDARDSVVFVAFGTITRLTVREVRAMVEVVRRLQGKHHVLWKLHENQQQLLPPRDELPANLRIEHWVPSQLDVLAHPHTKAFVSHGGGNSFHEAVYFGKPQVLRPLWVDCYDQAARGKDAGVSLTLDRPHTIDVTDALDKITRVLDEPSFRKQAAHYSQVLREAGGLHAAVDLILTAEAMKR